MRDLLVVLKLGDGKVGQLFVRTNRCGFRLVKLQEEQSQLADDWQVSGSYLRLEKRVSHRLARSTSGLGRVVCCTSSCSNESTASRSGLMEYRYCKVS